MFIRVNKITCAAVASKQQQQQQPGWASSKERKPVLSLYPTNPTSVDKLMLSFFSFTLIS